MSESVPAISRSRWLRLSAAVGAMMLSSIYQWFEDRQRLEIGLPARSDAGHSPSGI